MTWIDIEIIYDKTFAKYKLFSYQFNLTNLNRSTRFIVFNFQIKLKISTVQIIHLLKVYFTQIISELMLYLT